MHGYKWESLISANCKFHWKSKEEKEAFTKWKSMENREKRVFYCLMQDTVKPEEEKVLTIKFFSHLLFAIRTGVYMAGSPALAVRPFSSWDVVTTHSSAAKELLRGKEQRGCVSSSRGRVRVTMKAGPSGPSRTNF